MIWIIIIVAYLLLVAMAFGVLLQLNQDCGNETFVLLVFALTFVWVLVPFYTAITLGKIIAHYNE